MAKLSPSIDELRKHWLFHTPRCRAPRAAAESARSLLGRYSIMPANTEIGSFPPARSSPIGQGAILSTRTFWFTLTRAIEVQAAPSTSNAPSYFANSSDLLSAGIIARLA